MYLATPVMDFFDDSVIKNIGALYLTTLMTLISIVLTIDRLYGLPPPPPPAPGRPLGQPTPGVVKQGKSSGGSVDTTKTRSGPQRVRMSIGKRPIGAAKGKQLDTEALSHPSPPRPHKSLNDPALCREPLTIQGDAATDMLTRGLLHLPPPAAEGSNPQASEGPVGGDLGGLAGHTRDHFIAHGPQRHGTLTFPHKASGCSNLGFT